MKIPSLGWNTGQHREIEDAERIAEIGHWGMRPAVVSRSVIEIEVPADMSTYICKPRAYNGV